MLGSSLKVFLAPGATDLRKSINGLSVLAASGLELDVLSGSLFVFCNRKRDLIKIVYWDRNGFCLWMKRLEKETFQWPADFWQAGVFGPTFFELAARWPQSCSTKRPSDAG